MLLNEIIRRDALENIIKAVRDYDEDDEEWREKLRLYWDYVYLYRFGIPKPLPRFPLPNEEPTPTPMIQSNLDNSVLVFELISLLAGDPTPQSNLQIILQDHAPRLQAAEKAYQFHKEALAALEQEIAALQAG
jgi:hypothetical protein